MGAAVGMGGGGSRGITYLGHLENKSSETGRS